MMDEDPNAASKLDEAEHLLGELEHLEGELRRLQTGLTRSHRLATLGTMASIIAHEFNNILTPVISYCQLALKAGETDTALMTKALQRALSGAEKAAEISSSMLGFAREAHSESAANIERVVEEVFRCQAREPKKDGIQLVQEIPADLCVGMSPVGLQQVLLNLVLNARKVMRGRGGVLKIVARVEGTDRVAITVADSGPGIPAEIMPHIFKPFVTHEADGQSKSEEGTGLGLAVCRDLVERAGGAIAAESTGRGAIFRIELPWAPADEVESPADQESGDIRAAG